jgi:hypothetical protein
VKAIKKAEKNRLEAKQYPVIQRNLTENTIDSATPRKTPLDFISLKYTKIASFFTE